MHAAPEQPLAEFERHDLSRLPETRVPGPVSVTEAIELLGRACDSGHHAFWACEVSVLDPQAVDRSRLHGPRQVADAYLLGVATAHHGRFVTFDRSLSLASVHGATRGI